MIKSWLQRPETKKYAADGKKKDDEKTYIM